MAGLKCNLQKKAFLEALGYASCGMRLYQARRKLTKAIWFDPACEEQVDGMKEPGSLWSRACCGEGGQVRGVQEGLSLHG